MPNNKKIMQAAELLKRAEYVVALTGAGVSTHSGIPDFRSPGAGLWEKCDPVSVASIWAFAEYPRGFYDWVKPLARLVINAQPNPAHVALARLEAMGRVHTVITQNIDNLHQRAGSKRVLEVHGHMREATCIRCFNMVPARPLMERFLSEGAFPVCEICGGAMKPNVILFGEMPPVRVMYEAEEESKKCDVMLVAGSSLEVVPAADLPLVARKNGAKLIIVNNTPTPLDRQATIVLREDVVEALPRIVQVLKEE